MPDHDFSGRFNWLGYLAPGLRGEAHLPSHQKGDHHGDAHAQADIIPQREPERVVVDLVAANQEPDASEPQEEDRWQRPEHDWAAIERVAESLMNEIEHHDQNGARGGRQTQPEEEWRVFGHIAAAVDLIAAECA